MIKTNIITITMTQSITADLPYTFGEWIKNMVEKTREDVCFKDFIKEMWENGADKFFPMYHHQIFELYTKYDAEIHELIYQNDIEDEVKISTKILKNANEFQSYMVYNAINMYCYYMITEWEDEE